jgi:RNA polymerase sigma-70 factor (ECF subfamily)
MSSHHRQQRQTDVEALYENHGREIWAVAYARLGDAETATDLMQEAFLKLWKLPQGLAELRNPRGWLVRVVRNLAKDHAKSAFQRNGTQAPETMLSLRSREMPPLERLDRDERMEQLRSVLETLAPSDREVLTLRYALDYDASRIAEVLGTTVTAVHMRLSRARQRVADRLAALGVRWES